MAYGNRDQIIRFIHGKSFTGLPVYYKCLGFQIMQLRRPILLHILLEDGIELGMDRSPPSPNLRMTNGEILVI